jgi:hypothetical protein
MNGGTFYKPLRKSKMPCETCPFNDGLNEAATVAQNYGCLPTRHDIIDIKKTTGKNWACHGDETRICGGLAQAAKEAGLDISVGPLIKYSNWYLGKDEGVTITDVTETHERN